MMKWMVDARTVWLLALLASVSILLAAKSAIEDRRAVRLTRRAQATLDSLSKGRWVQLRDGDTVVTVIRAKKWPFQGRH